MTLATRKATQTQKTTAARRFVFILLDKFTMISFAGAIEPLRLANRVSGETLYTWVRCGEGAEKSFSNGATFRLDMGLEEMDREDTILVCGGLDVQRTTTKGIVSWLRREARRGVTIAGICTGGHALAKAGLLDGKKATIHWENQDGFS